MTSFQILKLRREKCGYQESPLWILKVVQLDMDQNLNSTREFAGRTIQQALQTFNRWQQRKEAAKAA